MTYGKMRKYKNKLDRLSTKMNERFFQSKTCFDNIEKNGFWLNQFSNLKNKIFNILLNFIYSYFSSDFKRSIKSAEQATREETFELALSMLKFLANESFMLLVRQRHWGNNRKYCLKIVLSRRISIWAVYFPKNNNA